MMWPLDVVRRECEVCGRGFAVRPGHGHETIRRRCSKRCKTIADARAYRRRHRG